MHIATVTHRAFSSNITFADFLRNNSGPFGSEFKLIVNSMPNESLEISCYRIDKDGETYNAYVTDFNVYPKKAINNLVNYPPTP